MMDDVLQVQFAQNQTQYQSFTLNLSENGIKTVGDILKALSRRLYLPANSFILKYRQELLKDDTVLVSNLTLDLCNTVTVVVIEPQEEKIPNAIPLIVAGFDFTNVKQIQQLFNKKKEEKRTGAVNSNSRKSMLQERGEIDLKEKYRQQIRQMKEFGIQDDEDELVVLLAQYDGNVERAVNSIYGA